jgi:Phosphopantetheine attachment site
MGLERHSDGYVAPSTANEKLLATLWQELLGVPRVGAHDNFFDVGGHSLLCLQMTSRLAEMTGVRLNPRIILRNDLSQVAAQLPPAGERSSDPPPPSLPPEPEKKSFAKRLLGRLIRS